MRKYDLSVLVYPSDGCCCAHWLEGDIVAEGDTTEKACADLWKAVGTLIDRSANVFSDYSDKGFWRAPKKYWKAFRDAKACKQAAPMPKYVKDRFVEADIRKGKYPK